MRHARRRGSTPVPGLRSTPSARPRPTRSPNSATRAPASRARAAGQGGRDLLATGLRARGAKAERLELYRRVAVDHSAEAVRAALDGCDAVVCTSGESLERLCALLPGDLAPTVRARLLVVPSPRVLELARRLGFEEVRAPQRTSDESLVECLFQAA